MSRKVTYLLILALCALMLTSIPATIGQVIVTDEPATPIVASEDGLHADSRPTSGIVTALIQLNTGGAARALAYQPRTSTEANVDAMGRSANIESQQRTFINSYLRNIPSLTVIGNLTWLNNGIVVNVDASQLDALEALPNVSKVYLDQIFELHHQNSIEYSNTPAAWTATVDGYTGEGMRVGIVDSGVDYFHTNFGGSGIVDYDDNDPAVITDGDGTTPYFPTDKVVGGFDYVGEGWDPNPNSPTFQPNLNPDPDPVDCFYRNAHSGHGTHVAGSAAGFGVNDDGTTFEGPWDDTVPFDTLRVGPGVAPEALIYAYKVGDCTSSISGLGALQAWDNALDPNEDGDPSDRLHVVNNSWGGSFGSMEDIINQQADLAVAAGVSIVFSAGNSGQITYTQDTNSNGVITVASIIDDGAANAAVVVTSDNVIAADTAFAATTANFGERALPSTVNGLVVQWDGGVNDPGALACDPNTDEDDDPSTNPAVADNAAAISGNVALINRGVCAFTEKIFAAQNAGASAVIIASDGRPIGGIGGSAPFPDIPAVMVSQEDGATLRTDALVEIEFQENVIPLDAGDQPSSFTSIGPRFFDGETIILKPDIGAPGQLIYSAAAGSDALGHNLSGTSMAAPHVAGAVALIRQINPLWDNYQVKAALMNTASIQIVNADGVPFGATRSGAGGMNVGSAAETRVIAFNTNRRDQVSISFGQVEVTRGLPPMTRSITVFNSDTTSAATYNVSIDEYVSLPGVSFSVSPTSVNVPAGGTATVTVTMVADAALMTQYVASPNQDLISGFREFLSEASGSVLFTATSEADFVDQDLRVAYMALPREASEMTATDSVTLAPDEENLGMFDIELRGDGINTEINLANADTVSLVTALELADFDGCGDGRSTVDYDGPWLSENLDINAIGVTSDFAATGSVEESTLFMGISTCGNFTNMNTDGLYFFMDLDNDGTYDVFLVNFLFGGVFNSALDVPVSVLFPLNGDTPKEYFGGINGFPAGLKPTYVYDNSVMFLTVPVEDLIPYGLDPLDPTFSYYARSNFRSDIIDYSPDTIFSGVPATYDIDDAAYNLLATEGPLAGLPVHHDANRRTITASYDVTGLLEAPDVLLLHHHNAGASTRGEIVDVILPETDATVEITNFAVSGDLENAPVYPSFSWDHETTPGEWYNVVVYETADNSNVVMDAWYEAADICVGDSCLARTGPNSPAFEDAALPLGLAAGEYSWSVSYWNATAGVVGPAEADADFITTSTAPEEPVITEPADEEIVTGNRVTIRATLSGVAWVNFNITGPNGSEIDEWYPANQVCGSTTCARFFDLYVDGAYEATVTGWNADAEGSGVTSTTVSFTLENPEVADIVKVEPEDEANVTDPIFSFRWETQEGIEWYRLTVTDTDSSAQVFQDWYRCFSSSCGTSGVYLPNGDYSWVVEAWNNTEIAGAGTASTFTLDAAAVGEVNLLLPVDGTSYGLDQLEFAFEDAGASWYEIYVGNPVTGETLFFDWVRRDGVVDGSAYNSSAEGARLCRDLIFGGDAPICEFDLTVTEGDWQFWMRGYSPAGVGPWQNVGNELQFSVELP